MSKKAFFIAPLFFIAFFIIAYSLSQGINTINEKQAYFLQKQMEIDKGFFDLKKLEISNNSLLKVKLYNCSETANNLEELDICTNSKIENYNGFAVIESIKTNYPFFSIIDAKKKFNPFNCDLDNHLKKLSIETGFIWNYQKEICVENKCKYKITIKDESELMDEFPYYFFFEC